MSPAFLEKVRKYILKFFSGDLIDMYIAVVGETWTRVSRLFRKGPKIHFEIF